MTVTRYHGGANITKEVLSSFGLLRNNLSAANFHDRHLYVTGGHDLCRPSRIVFYFDLMTQLWEIEDEQMKQDRQGHSSCVLGRNLWVFGGMCGINWLNSIEVFDVVDHDSPW